MKLTDVEIQKMKQRTEKLWEILPGLSGEAVKESLEYLLEDTEHLFEEMDSLKKDLIKATELGEKEKRLLARLQEKCALLFEAKVQLQNQKTTMSQELIQFRSQKKADELKLRQVKVFVEHLLPALEYMQTMEVFPTHLWAGVIEKVKEQAKELGCDVTKKSGCNACHYADTKGGKLTVGCRACQQSTGCETYHQENKSAQKSGEYASFKAASENNKKVLIHNETAELDASSISLILQLLISSELIS